MGIVYLLLGLAVGAIIGWLARGNLAERDLGTDPVDPVQLQRTNTEHFERSLEHSLDPVNRAVSELAEQVRELERDRHSANTSLATQIQAITRTAMKLNDRAENLVLALRSPQVRGRWGAIQLERVVELGGMVRHCDFSSQLHVRLGGRVLRPDLVVHLAGERQIIIDAQVPFGSYLDAMDSSDAEEQSAFLRRHAHQLRNHVSQLAAGDYAEAFSPTPEFVVLFVPADPFLDAALSADPELLEFAFERNVVLATPTTLFALLRTLSLGWRQEEITDKAREVNRLGQDLYGRLNSMADQFNEIGMNLDKTTQAYNATLDSLDSRVMVTARRLAELEIPVRSKHHPTPLEPAISRPRHARGEGVEKHLCSESERGNPDHGGADSSPGLSTG
ncbi:DNA recombination protein RmuC [Corynebacterium sp. A21]|uniref:DNA recombination protein RmuC n=1 Tax=Corynebacterium sp. A21 TaxID=3457318 RepID=UPI003FD177ED